MSERSNPIKMIDVSEKEVLHREAEATGRIRLKPETIEKIRSGEVKKGNPLPAAEIACILAAKKTPELLPLCHPIKTGVEMEALTGISVALLTIWDMVKYLEKDENGQYPSTVIAGVKVTEKRKG
jgi:cyclic pyranopterin phosphate synthase